jgi:chromosome segregation ATPase
MEAIEGDAEEMESPLSFLQRPHLDAVGMATRELDYELDHPETMAVAHEHSHVEKPSSADAGRQAVMMLLKKQGATLHSSLLAELATTIAVDPFAKVTKLLQELVERLLQQAGNEANQKGWCDKNIGEAEQKRDYNQGKLDKLNAEKDELSARADSLSQDLATLTKEIKGLNKAQAVADKTRKAETVENAATVKEAIEGLNAVKQAMDVLNKFYKTANNERTNKIKLGLMQGPSKDAPATTFEAKEAYKGNQGAAGGILGMLQVIMGDFVRTVKQAEQAEASADKDHLKLSTRTQMSLAEKKQSSTIKSAQKDEAKQNIEETKASIKAKSALLKGVLKELKELEPVCSPSGQSAKERAEKRKEEVKALQKALELFENFVKK